VILKKLRIYVSALTACLCLASIVKGSSRNLQSYRNAAFGIVVRADVSYSVTEQDVRVFRPHKTVAAVGAVQSRGIVSIVTGSYTAANGNKFTAGQDGKAMRFEAPVGVVVIGN
jgi:hypothetical protein